MYHLVCVVALDALASALIMLALLFALALSPSLCWHHCPHCAGIAALVMLELLPLLCWCCYCLWCGLPRHPRLSTCQLYKGKDTCVLTAHCKHNNCKKACRSRVLMPVHHGQQRQRDKGNNTSTTVQTCQVGVLEPGTLNDESVCKVPLPCAPLIQSTRLVTRNVTATHDNGNTCYLGQVPRIPRWHDLPRLIARICRTTIMPLLPVGLI
jgi:hypothetical protein